MTLAVGECPYREIYSLDSIASVKSQDIIGDKYIQISLGGDLENFAKYGLIVDTELAVDIESLINKFAFASAQ